MSDSQEQSLNEDAVFLPVNESSPEFLHCEKERQAVESLINSGPEAFYASIGTERSGCFLSSEEVNQIASWAQDYRFNPQLVQSQQNGERSGPEMEGFCSTYFPHCSDTPAPNLELGWPETGPWAPQGSVTVHTNPPAEGEPSIREIIRRHLQKAGQVIAIVTDRLTDGAVIGDLHNAAFRGVPVYIILNQRSIQDNFTLNRLRHPNMQVRVLGGKSFCSRTGKMVVGEMKEKFVLVDLETVIHGSYSLTWTDTHLHRQLVTVLSGPVVESFDREFRILFAASLPVPDSWRVAGCPVDMTLQLKDHSDLLFKRQNHMETDIINPPSPPADSLLDWEAMGVIQRDCMSPGSPQYQHEDIMAMDIPLHSKMLFNRNTPIMGGFISNGNQPVENKRLYENSSPVTNNVPDKPTALKNLVLSPTDLMTSEKTKRLYENSSPVINNVPDKPTALKNLVLSPTDLKTSEKTKRLYENSSPVTNNVPDKPTALKDLVLSPTDLMTSEKTKRLYENSSPVTNNVPDKPTALKNLMLSPTDLMTSEKIKRVDHIINKAISRQLSTEKPTNLDDIKTTRLDDEPAHNMVLLSPKRREPSRAQFTVAEQASMTDTSPRVENSPSSRKPLILRMPQSESFSSLSDIMKRLQSQQSTAPARRRHQTAASELSQSMMDLSVHHKEEDRGVPVPRFKTSQSFDPDHMTPALALMKKRNDEVKPSLYRTPKNYLPRERPRNSSHALWRRSWAEPEIEHD